MQRELVSDNIFVFTSDIYAQVTAGAILTSEGAIVIDTLPYPTETRQIIQFVEQRHRLPVRYVINSHYHADHTSGTCLFRHAQVVGHRHCREMLNGAGRAALNEARRTSREMAKLRLRLPELVFDTQPFSIHLGGITVQMWHTPGHSPDGIACLVKEEKVLFAADTVMPIPFFADGSWADLVNSLNGLFDWPFETIVQGHGDVILRGEVPERLEADLAYLNTLRTQVEEVITRGGDIHDALEHAGIEQCGKSRILLNGLAVQLHESNVRKLYQELSQSRAA